MSTEVESLVRSTLVSIGGSGMISSTVEGLMAEYSTVKETSALNDRQINQFRSQLEQKIKERKETLVSKQQKKRSKASM